MLKNNTKQIEVGGKTYTLTARRSIIFRIAEICPELLKIKNAKNKNEMTDEEQEKLVEIELNASDKLYENMPKLFYELINYVHKDITREKSDEIYLEFNQEYNDVDEHLLNFIYSVFTDGIPREQKKNLDW